MTKDSIKKYIYFLGKSLGLLGLVYVFYKLSQEYTFSTFVEQFMLLSPIFFILIIINITSILVGIFAWHNMLLHYAKKPFPLLASYYYFTKTEIAKYLPGNIFHFLGRQILADKIGISQSQMAKSSLLLSFLLLTGTILVSTIFAFISYSVSTTILTLMIFSSMTVFISIFYLYPSFPLRKKVLMNGYLALSIALQGIMLAIIVMYQSEDFTTNLFFLCISIYTVSWLIGFITPGASGGVGIREGIFIAIATYLHINIDPNIIIFSVLLVRLINICVDVIMYLSAYAIERKIKEFEI